MSLPWPTPLIDAATLRAHLSRPDAPVVLDCSFDLADPSAGRRAFSAAHLPGARYVHLDHDLSGPKTARGAIDGGRHPLPSREAFARRVGSWGIAPATQVVVYDQQGSPYAARAWWMLRWLGHELVSVLDGGWAAWRSAGGELETGEGPAPAVSGTPYPLAKTGPPTLTAQDLRVPGSGWTVLDARAPERFRGEVEPLDTQAGHIPGARNRFFKHNLAEDGRFRPAAELRAAFQRLGVPAVRVVHQCGSGVTACHNLLAMEAAGLPGSALYPGSWSEWSSDLSRPVAKG